MQYMLFPCCTQIHTQPSSHPPTPPATTHPPRPFPALTSLHVDFRVDRMAAFARHMHAAQLHHMMHDENENGHDNAVHHNAVHAGNAVQVLRAQQSLAAVDVLRVLREGWCVVWRALKHAMVPSLQALKMRVSVDIVGQVCFGLFECSPENTQYPSRTSPPSPPTHHR